MRGATVPILALVLICSALQPLRAQVQTSLSENWTAGVLELTIEHEIDAFTPAERSRIQGRVERMKSELFLAAAVDLQISSSMRLAQWIEANPHLLPSLTARIDAVPLAASSYNRQFGRLRFRYEIPLFPDFADPFITHARGYDLPPTLFYKPSAPFSGILIYAGGEYPVHGENRSDTLHPALLPRIWDGEMNLLFSPAMIDRSLLLERGPLLYSRTLDGPRVLERIGPNPVRILARELFGVTATDPVIPRGDALTILNSSEGNRLLREGRIVIVY